MAEEPARSPSPVSVRSVVSDDNSAKADAALEAVFEAMAGIASSALLADMGAHRMGGGCGGGDGRADCSGCSPFVSISFPGLSPLSWCCYAGARLAAATRSASSLRFDVSRGAWGSNESLASSASARTNGSGAAAGGDGGGGSTSRLFSSGFSIPGRGPRGVRLGWGLHAGWAIEGAIGSDHKIDASYLSPHVNISARLEGATKQVSQRVERGTNVGRSLLLANKWGQLSVRAPPLLPT